MERRVFFCMMTGNRCRNGPSIIYRYQHKKDANKARIRWQMLVSYFVLAFARSTVDNGYSVMLRPSPHSATESACHAHQMSIIQASIRSVQIAPPGSETSRCLAHRVIGVYDNTVHAVVVAFEKLRVVLCELIVGLHTCLYTTNRLFDSTATVRWPLFPGEGQGKA